MSQTPTEKKCGRCGTVKPAADFGINTSRYDGLQCHCRQCKRAIQAQWYVKNKSRHVGIVVKQRKERVFALRARLHEYLANYACVDCGESETLMLDFDHVRGEKRYNISNMVCACLSWETILAEIAKCEVRCVRCHRRRTAAQLGWGIPPQQTL